MISPSVALPKLNANKNFWISLGVIVWVYFVVSNFPAIWGAYALTRGGDLAMSGVTGSIWSGRASLASVKIKGVDHSLGQLTWKLNVLSLFTLKPCAQVTTQMDNQDFDGYVCYRGKNGIELKDASANFPAVLAQPLLPLAIDGQFTLNLTHLKIEDGKLQTIRGKTSWSNAKIFNGSNWMALGGIGADLVDDGKNGLSAHIVDGGGPIRLDLVTNLPYPTGGSVKGGFSLPESLYNEMNAAAWLSMFAVQQANDQQGNLAFVVDLNF
ncbi:MAG: type II secretion system protein N [Cellvibrio sp.]